MTLLATFPTEYTKEGYEEYLRADGNEMAVLLDEANDDGFGFWVSLQQELDYEDFLGEVQAQLNKTKIKKGFLEIHNGGWQKKHGMSLPFEVNSTNLVEKLRDNTDTTVEVYKEGRVLKFKRYSHDEPTGANVTLHSMNNYDKVKNSIW
jgi:hypothetical protein